MTASSYPEDWGKLLGIPPDLAGRLADITYRKLLYWDLTNLVRPAIRRRVGRTMIRLYNFDDMVALIVTANLRRRGVSLQHVREIVTRIRETYSYDSPLAQLTFGVHGRRLYFMHPDGMWEDERVSGQAVIREVIPLDEIRSQILNGLKRPADAVGRVERRRGKLGNKPTFMGTRIPVATVQRWLENGKSKADILEAYPDLEHEDIELARRAMLSTGS